MTTVNLLQAFPNVAEHYRRRFRHIMVDEYQDTNHAQYTLVRELAGVGRRPTTPALDPAELTVVGDSDQSIYAFRGATIRNILEFEKDYPDATTILLEQNYRSTQNILSAANAVISRNAGRTPKRLWTDSGAGAKIVGYVADDEHQEARFVADEIDKLGDADERAPGRRRDLLPHQRAVACARGGAGPRRPAVQGGGRHAVLRAPRGQGRRRLPARAGQRGRRREPAPHPQRAQARARGPRGVARGVVRASGSASPSAPPWSAPTRSPA